MVPRLELLSTRQSLICRLKDQADQSSWQQFYDTYGNFIFSFALRSGCTHAEAEEVLQETVINVARHLPKFDYNPKVCAFKTWLLNQTLWRVRDTIRARKPLFSLDETRAESLAADDGCHEPGQNQLEAIWEAEWQEHLFQIALKQVAMEISTRQFQIFDLYVLKNWAVADVAQTLGVSRTTIYLAKHRVAALLKKKVARLQREN